MRSLELFAGCGGLAYGIAEAGFDHELIVEVDKHACDTINLNSHSNVSHFSDWSVSSSDVRDFDFTIFNGAIDLVSGGPPCQPFSVGGKHKGPGDRRNMWPEAVRAVKEVQPKAFIFENVRGLLRPAFDEYLDFIRLSLSWPELFVLGDGWEKQLKKLRLYRRAGNEPTYKVFIQSINAADYGAPQKRHRAIVWGVYAGLAGTAQPLMPTHSKEALVWSQKVSGTYWKRHGILDNHRPKGSLADQRIYEKLKIAGIKPTLTPWVTVRDTISDLPKPLLTKELVKNHLLHPGARLYPGHTGSSFDEPAKALKAGVHGVPGGENTLVGMRGSVRYFTVREMIRLQGLPDNFEMESSWMSSTKQLGNAVPVQVGQALATHIRKYIIQTESESLLPSTNSLTYA